MDPFGALASQFYKLRLSKETLSQQFKDRINQGIHTSNVHADFPFEYALTFIPVDEIHSNTFNLQNTLEIPFVHSLTKSLLKWFKNDFFTWVNLLPCEKCASITANVGTDNPNKIEQSQMTSRTELHKCTICHHITRFPRINDPKELLVTKRGRCGEWANCFGIICRAMGIETRYVLDFTDHVWLEIYCDEQARWIHVDPCEEAFDTPFLYEQGWGKKLSYCIAYGDHEVFDVTWKYVVDFMDTVPRRIAFGGESRILEYLKNCSTTMESGCSAADIDELHKRQKCEFVQRQANLLGTNKNLDWSSLSGRQSGSSEWKTQRGEMGGK